jgi:hypothetical protein
MDIYRDNERIALTENDGIYDDNDGLRSSAEASNLYHVCEAGSPVCSNIVSVTDDSLQPLP